VSDGDTAALPRQLEALDREQLLQTSRKLLAEADALSSRISVLNEIGLAINESLDLERIEHVIAKKAKWLLDFDHCSVCLKEDDDWRIKTLFGGPEPETLDLGKMPNLAQVIYTPRPVIIKAGSESTFLKDYASQIIIPLMAESGFMGAICFATTESNRYTRDDLRIGHMLALQLSSAIRNARNFAELQVTQAELKMRVEELDAYGHTIAHDLKGPLGNVKLRAEMFSMKFREQVPEAATKLVAGIGQSADQMTQMVNQLLTLAKLRTGDEQFTPVNVRKVVDAALERYSHLVETKGIHVEVSELPDACGQAQWIEEIFANLISNAIKYMGQENATPSITITGTSQPAAVRYEVRDTGIGIKPEAQGSLFEMFSRVHEVPDIEGIGLGLSIVSRIITRLRGEIGVESTYGEGTTFWFTLPPATTCVEGELSP